MYNRPKEKDFSDIDQLNMDSFRAIPKSVILELGLSKVALAIYPVLCCEADFEKNEAFHISQANIARFAGVSENSVRNALKELENAGLLTKEKVTDGTRHFYVYKVRRSESEANEQCGEAINFYTCIIENGIWASLPLGAKAIYLFLRAEAKQDLDIYSKIEEIEAIMAGEFYGPMEYPEYIRNRKWDICETSLTKISRAVGVTRSKIGTYLETLERFKLIERVDRWIMVYLRPRRLLRHKNLV